MKEICLPRGQPSKVRWFIIRAIFTVNVNMCAVVLEVHRRRVHPPKPLGKLLHSLYAGAFG